MKNKTVYDALYDKYLIARSEGQTHTYFCKKRRMSRAYMYKIIHQIENGTYEKRANKQMALYRKWYDVYLPQYKKIKGSRKAEHTRKLTEIIWEMCKDGYSQTLTARYMGIHRSVVCYHRLPRIRQKHGVV